MNIRKVLAGGLAALTAGATVAFGAFAQSTSLKDYVVATPEGVLTSPIIVVPSYEGITPPAGLAKDIVGAADIAAAVAGYATQEVSVGTGTTVSVSNGVDISTANTKIYLGDSLTKSGLKTTLTKNDLPTLLASGTVTDDSGNTYPYDQYITLSAGTVTAGKSNGDLSDPAIYIDTGYSTTTPLYKISIVFNKLLNASSTDVQGNSIEILGQAYSIGAGSSDTKLVLYSSANKQTISQGETVTVNIDGVDHEIGLIGTSSTTTAVITVDGESRSVTKGNSYTIAGLNVYIEDVFYFGGGATAPPGQVVLSVSTGASKITLENGQPVKVGTQDDIVDGTLVSITSTSGQGISKIEISVTAKDQNADYILEGEAFTDPVFGSFKIAFGGMNMGTTDTITVDNSGTTAASLKVTDYRGNEKTITWAYTSSSNFNPALNETSTRQFHVVEGEAVKKGDYVLLAPSQGSEFGHIMQYTSSGSLGQSGAYIDLKDVFTGTTTRVYLTEGNNWGGTFYIDGQQYYVNSSGSGSSDMVFTWGTTASRGSAGNETTVFPLIKLNGGEWFTLTTKVNLTDNTWYELPTGTFKYNVSADYNSLKSLGRVKYNITNGDLALANPSDNTQLQYPAVLVLEEKAKDANNNDVQDAIIVTIADGSGSGVDLTIQAPLLTATGASTGYTKESDNSVTVYADRRGTMVEHDTDSQGLVTITYPDEQATANVAVGPDPQFSVAGEAGTVEQAIKITTPVAKLDNEINTASLTGDLILIGGPCANKLVAQLAEDETTGIPACDAWDLSKGLIKEVTNAFGSGKKALVVAGTTADDTRELAAKVMQGVLSFEE